MRCRLPTNELDLLDSGGRGFSECSHPLFSRDDAVRLTWPTRSVAMAAFKLTVARYLKPHEVRVTQRRIVCDDSVDDHRRFLRVDH